MKTIIATIAILSTSTMASAEFKATTEYAKEAETFAVGLDYSIDFDSFDLSVGSDWNKAQTGNLAYTGTSVGLGYEVNTSLRVYGKVDLDSNFNYSETTVGAEFTF